ncbi:hypothetical protein PG995_016150 [Apiospora arundinis]
MKLAYLLAFLPVAALTNANPEDSGIHQSGVLEFDLVFPRSETYASTQYFPLVLAVRNATAAWPHGLRVVYRVWPHSLEAPPYEGLFEIPRTGGTFGPPPTAPNYFVIAGSNLMNATIGGFTLIWTVSMLNTCRDDPFGDQSTRSYHSKEHNVKFTIAEGAPLPDIEAAVNACPIPDSVLAITPHGWRDGVCPIISSNDTSPSNATPCGLKPIAKELSGEVSEAMLGLMGCSEGTWQTIKAPCLPKEKSDGLRRAVSWNWVLVPVLCMATALML